jgi:hypothetical protein
MTPRDQLIKGIDLVLEHSPPEVHAQLAEGWYNDVERNITKGTSTGSFGCFKAYNGEVKLANTNVTAGSSRSSL